MKLSLLLCIILTPNLIALPNNNPLQWSIGAEAGYYHASGSSLLKQTEFVSQFRGILRYKANNKNHDWLTELRLRPEFYGWQDSFTIWKFAGKGQYQHRFSKIHLTASLSLRRNWYFSQTVNPDFTVFKISGGLIWFYKRRTFFRISAGGFYRDLNDGFGNSLEAVTLTGKIYHSFSRFGRIGAGAYLEKFQIEAGRNTNAGWRTGPQVSLDYSRHVVVNINYHFLFHRSDLAEDPGNEHWIQFLFGKLLSRRWSVFLLADYYFRHFPDPPDSNNPLIYLPIDNENSFYLKLEYDAKTNMTLFLNLGFSKENLIYQDLNLSGFKGTVGVEVAK